mgnify:CR=1 FL=1
MARRNVYVDQNECTSCQLCVEMCPEVFGMSDEGFSEVINPEGAPEDNIQEAIDNCPVSCIHWEE